tara:strand:- start:1695 stop:1916 length:222 start_codon:yes stop_codon:yes gene_type:complete
LHNEDIYLQSDHPDFKRDQKTNALLNTNTRALAEYKARKNAVGRIDTVENDLNNMKQDINEIKSLLLKILEKE